MSAAFRATALNPFLSEAAPSLSLFKSPISAFSSKDTAFLRGQFNNRNFLKFYAPTKQRGVVVSPSCVLPLTEENVEKVLDEVRPGLMADGGNVALHEIDGLVVVLKLQGACGSSPSSTMTLKMGIETRLRHKIPEILEVEQIMNTETGLELNEDNVEKENEIVEPRKMQNEKSSMETAKLVTRDRFPIRTSERNSIPPLVSALETCADQNAASFHFPGHNRGRAAPSSLVKLIGLKPFIHDLPELPEIDNLFSPEGPILEAQKQAATLFGSSETWFLVGGTTCGIQAAIMATCSPGEYLILPRNSHISAISAMVLSGVIPKYIIPEYDCHWDITVGVTVSQIDKAIQELRMEGQKVGAVFITSPTYHGICSNLTDISKLCHSYEIPMIVDEAHGAHFGFHPKFPPSALQQGADLAVQSTHKVLCSLTQSSMLHMAGNIVDRERICRCLQTLQSTSPSYLLLASLDAARAQLSENPTSVFNNALDLAIETKNLIGNIPGISLLDFPVIDPLRLTFGFWQLGLSGFEADETLYRDQGVISELAGTQSITFAINLGTCRDHILRLASGIKDISESSSSLSFKEIEGRVEHGGGSAPFTDITMCLSPRESFFARKRKVVVGESVGKICGELICPYPPGIPVMIPGEIITKKAVEYLLLVKNKGATISGASDPLLSSILICDI